MNLSQIPLPRVDLTNDLKVDKSASPKGNTSKLIEEAADKVVEDRPAKRTDGLAVALVRFGVIMI